MSKVSCEDLMPFSMMTFFSFNFFTALIFLNTLINFSTHKLYKKMLHKNVVPLLIAFQVNVCKHGKMSINRYRHIPNEGEMVTKKLFKVGQ